MSRRLGSREYLAEPSRVTIAMMSGESRVGRIGQFSPEAEEVVYTAVRAASSTQEDKTEIRVHRDQIAFLAFHSAAKVRKDPKPGDTKDYTIHLSNGRRLTVHASIGDILDPIGFYASAVQKGDPIAEYFFYRHGINVLEDAQPLGEMLVNSGLLAQKDVERGLEEQKEARSAPLGRILVEQMKLSPQEVEAAVAKQQGQKKRKPPLRLGELLVEAGLATEADIQAALDEQKRRKGKRLGEILVELGIIEEATLAQALAKKFHLPYVDFDITGVDPVAAALIPQKLIERYQVLPIKDEEEGVTVALADPLGLEAMDMLRFLFAKRVFEVIVRPSQMAEYIQKTFAALPEETGAGQSDEVGSILLEFEADQVGDTPSAPSATGITVSHEDDRAVAKLVTRIITDGVRQGASDIHLEPNGPEKDTQVRFRVDGSCQLYRTFPPAVRSQMVARIKIMARMDISEHRKPQDGKIKFRLDDRIIELRVATIPTAGSDEDVVMRILASGKPLPLEKLSLSERNLSEIRKVIAKPYGLILAVGPTGSGKTTTLHSLLSAINTVERKIWTAEDPVEISQDGLRQVQVNSKIGFTFAAAMRAFLRADPDVIMVGEMRDEETANTGVEASLTGHLVLSTLHTNSAPETVTRLIEMGLDPFTFSDALLGVLAQRLARRICQACKEPYRPEGSDLDSLVSHYGEQAFAELVAGAEPVLWRATGCEKCSKTGLSGRVGIHEFLLNDEAIRLAIQRKQPVAVIRDLSIQGGMKTLLQDGIEKCLRGLTEPKHILAVCSR